MAVSPEPHTSLVSDFGEIELIHRFFERQPVTVNERTQGIGDDCAVLDYSSRQKLLVTTDQLAERIHFLKENSSARNIGFKSVAVNFSDIGAMGGRPTGLFLSLALPAQTPVTWLEEFREGFFELSEQYEVPLLGGDTTGSKQDIVISVTVLGKVNSQNVKLRSGAKDGDVLCVTGTSGDSAAGLRLLSGTEGGSLNDAQRSHLIKRHLRPVPALGEGNWLGRETGVHAMIDLSDGLVTDAGHIASRSEVGIEVDLDCIPVSDSFKAYMKGQKGQEDELLELALTGGEDYNLLCTVAGSSYADVSRRFEQKFNTPLYKIGSVTDEHQKILFVRNGEPFVFSGSGFNHFNSEHDL